MSTLSEQESKTFDTIRWISAFIVLLAHTISAFFFNLEAGTFIPSLLSLSSQLAVTVFFVMSGFLISISIHSNIDRNGKFIAQQYFSARMIRIYPPLIFSILFIFILSNIGESFGRFGLFNYQHYLSSMFFFNGILTPHPNQNTPLWSLAIEVWLYIFVGVLYLKRLLLTIFASVVFYVILIIVDFRFICFSIIWMIGFISGLIFNHSPKVISLKNLRLTFLVFLIFFMFTSYLWLSTPFAWTNKQKFIYYVCLFSSVFISSSILLLLRMKKFKFIFMPEYASFAYTLYICQLFYLFTLVGITGFIQYW